MTHERTPLRDLVLNARKGDRSAFDELVRRTLPTCHSIARTTVRDAEAAEDLVQEVFLRAWLGIGELRDPDAFAAWTIRMTRNLALNWKRGRIRQSSLARMVPMDTATEEQLKSPAPSPATQTQRSHDEAAVLAALARLTEEERTLIRMHYLEQRSQRDLARDLGTHHNSVGRRLAGALGSLRRLLGVAPPIDRTEALHAKVCGLIGAVAVAGPTLTTPLAQLAKSSAPESLAALHAQGAFGSGWLPAILHPLAHKAAAGAYAMSFINKAAVLTTVLVIGGAAYYGTADTTPAGAKTNQPAATASTATATPTAPAREVAFQFGTEQVVTVVPGEPVEVRFVGGQEGMPESALLSVNASGELEATTRYADGRVTNEILPPTRLVPGDPGQSTTIQVWAEKNRCFVQSHTIVKTETGVKVAFFARNEPSALPKLQSLVQQYNTGRISRAEAAAAALAEFDAAGLLPQDPGNRATVEHFLKEGMFR